MMSGIYRVNKNTNYSVISNVPLNDTRLTWEARGVMAYLLSKPDEWECRNYDLVKQGQASEHIISRVIKELQQYGYIYREKVSEGRNQIKWVTEVYESPEQNPHFSIPQNFSLEKFDLEKIPDIVNTESSVNTHSIKRENPPSKSNEPIPGPFTQALLTLCQINYNTATVKLKKTITATVKGLETAGATIEQLESFALFWKSNWRGKDGSPPTLNLVRECWGEFETWDAHGRPRPNGKDSVRLPDNLGQPINDQYGGYYVG